MKLIDQLRNEIRYRHYSIRTEKAYIDWVKRFIHFHDRQHPNTMGEKEIKQFLNWIATKGNVAASTQNQALCSILFLYKNVLQKEIEWIHNIKWAKRPRKLPVVFSETEIQQIMLFLEGIHWLIANIMYGSGLRLNECVSLRVHDIDFAYQQITREKGSSLLLTFFLMTLFSLLLFDPLLVERLFIPKRACQKLNVSVCRTALRRFGR